MAWQTPYTTWSNGNRFTYDDMNRIAGNVNYLYAAADLKDDYTNNDFLSASEWTALQAALQTLIATTGLSAEVPGDAMTADTINEVESLIQDLYDRITLNQAQAVAVVHVGQGYYTAETAQNYLRGV